MSPAVGELPSAVLSLLILETIAGAGGDCGVTQLAERVGIPKARLHRHITALREHGFLARDEKTSRYRIGWRLFVLGQQLVQGFGLGTIARPIMEELRDETGHTVVVSTFTRDSMVVLDYVLGSSAVVMQMQRGTQFPLNAVAQGKVALAFGPDDLRDDVLSTPLQSRTAHTITDPKRLRREIELTRRRGWADAPEEMFSGVNAIAAPIFAGDGSFAGTLTTVAATHFIATPAPAETVQALRRAAGRISQALGHPDPTDPSA